MLIPFLVWGCQRYNQHVHSQGQIYLAEDCQGIGNLLILCPVQLEVWKIKVSSVKVFPFLCQPWLHGELSLIPFYKSPNAISWLKMLSNIYSVSYWHLHFKTMLGNILEKSREKIRKQFMGIDKSTAKQDKIWITRCIWLFVYAFFNTLLWCTRIEKNYGLF